MPQNSSWRTCWLRVSFLFWNNQIIPNLSKIFWNTHLMKKTVLIQGRRQSNVISVNHLFFSEQNSKRKTLENIVLKITVYTRKNHFLWLESIPLCLFKKHWYFLPVKSIAKIQEKWKKWKTIQEKWKSRNTPN